MTQSMTSQIAVSQMPHSRKKCCVFFPAIAGVMLGLFTGRAFAQLPEPKIGEAVPRDVREMYDRGLQFLANSQTANGDWQDQNQGPGVTGLALMAFLASGEDPNFGIYSSHIRKAVRSIINGQDTSTGYFGNSMYHHGFALLALSEAYGTVDD